MVETVLSIVSTVVLTLLGLYFLVSRQRQGTHLVFFLFCLLLALTEVFDRLSLNLNPSYRLYAMAAESLLPGTILLLSIMHSRKDPFNVNFFMKLMLVTSIAFPVSIFLIKGNGFYFAPDLQTEGMVFLTDQGYYFYLAMMFYFILALINLEATFVASRGSERWRLKFLFMGLVCIIAMEILYTSQALLYRTLNLNILPSRSVVFILGAILIGYSKLFRGNNVAISVSRTVLYRSLALLAVGVYLILLGALGEGLKYTGINYSENLLLIFGFIAGVAVLTVLFSEQVRRRIRVFINKHFYSHKHDYRNQWLNFTERLSKCRTSEEISRAIVETFKETFGLKWTALFVLDREEGIYKPLYPANGLTGVSLPGESPMIGYFKEKKRVFNSDSREYIPDERESAFIKERDVFLIIPLQNNGDVEGLVLCGEQIIREELTFEDYDLMKTLAKQATLSLINQRLSEELARTRQLAAVAKLSSFVVHDLKNMASSLSLVIENAKEYINEPEFQQDLLNTLDSTVNKMNQLMSRLRQLPEKQEIRPVATDLSRLTSEVLKGLSGANGRVSIKSNLKEAPALVDPEEFKKVVLNMLLNAIEATPSSGGEVVVETGKNGDNTVFLSISDNGTGMSEDFIRYHLFKPFSTTKRKGLGIGLYQCKQIIDAHRGRIEVSSTPGRGTTFTISLKSQQSQ